MQLEKNCISTNHDFEYRVLTEFDDRIYTTECYCLAALRTVM